MRPGKSLFSRTKVPKYWHIAALVFIALPAGSLAQVTATRVSQSAVQVDGKLTDAAWQTVSWTKSFTQREPVEGVAPAAATEIAFLFDDDALYIGARMHSAPGTPVRALVTRRDRESSSEQLIVSLDTYRDRRTAYSFGVTAAGVRMDYFHASDAQSDRDYSFDPVWEAAADREGDGWTAELRIPFTQLRFNKAAAQVFGVNVTRRVPALNEEDYLVLVKRNETGWASRFADLVGIEGIGSSRRIELLPYVASSALLLGDPDAGNPFVAKQSIELRAGADVKVGLGPSLTLDATINPDFGQVEADPAQVNLSAFEIVFPERRPFFTEGAQLLRSNQLSFFLSRRVGQSPRYSPDADYVEPVVNTTILGAAKVTGRLPSGLSVGVLTALTGPERARTFKTAGNEFGEEVIEPMTSFGVVRLQQEFGKNRSTAGFILTNVHRNVAPGSPLAGMLPRNAITGAVESQLRFKNGEYRVVGTLGFSHVTGDTAAILRVQQSPVRFFGRPDAPYAAIDPSLRSINGTFIGLGAAKVAGSWLWQTDIYSEAPGFEINDAGRIGQADDRGIGFTLRRRQTVPGKRFRYWEVGASTFNEWNFGGVHQGTILETFTNQTWLNLWQTNVRVSYFTPALIDNLTRGGPLMGFRASWSVAAGLSTSAANKTQWRLSPYYDADRMGGWTASLGAGVSMRPSDRIELTIDPSYARWVDARQYMTTLSGGTAATFGNRYIFAHVDRSEIATTLRLNYALGRDLTLETYARPFASSGRFYRIGELPAARSYDIRTYGTDGTTIQKFATDSIVVTDGSARFTLDDRDFNVLSFRSNFVLRWEWRPGSTAYVVWQQNRGDQTISPSRVRPGSLFDALTAKGDNVFAVKLNYWLPF